MQKVFFGFANGDLQSPLSVKTKPSTREGFDVLAKDCSAYMLF